MANQIIELENMEFHAFHGCYPLEQVVGNKFIVNVAIEANLKTAGYSDDVRDTINYLNVYNTVSREMGKTSHILENVAARIVEAIYEDYPSVKAVTVKVSKLAPPLGGKIEKVSVTFSK